MRIRKILSILLCLVILSLSVPSVSAAENTDSSGTASIEVASFDELVDGSHGTVVTVGTEGEKIITIPENVVILTTGRIIIDEPVTITGGGVIKRSSNLTDTQMFSIRSGGNVLLTDIIIDGGAVWQNNVVSSSTNSGVAATFPAFILVGSLTLGQDAVIRNCYNSYTGSTASHGGAVVVGYDAGSVISINGGRIENCYSGNSGGALCMYLGTLNLSDAVITGCQSNDSVIYLKQNNAAVHISGNTVIDGNNHNIKLSDSQKIIVDGALGESAKIGLNVSAGDAERVADYYPYAGADNKFYETSKFFCDDPSVRLVGITGGGLKAVSASEVTAVWQSGDAMDSGTFAQAAAASNRAASKTVIYLLSDTATVSSTSSAAAVFEKDTELIIPENTTLTVNAFLSITGSLKISGGGTVLRGSGLTGQQMLKNQGNLALQDITFDGGAVWTDGVVSPATNAGVTSSRPAILNMRTMTLGEGAVVKNNCNALSDGSAHQLGGGIMNYGYTATSGAAVLTVDGGTITGCYSSARGSAIYSDRSANAVNGSVVLNNASINGNVTSSVYGAVLWPSSALSVRGGSVVYGNTSTFGGSSVSADIYVPAGSTFTIAGPLGENAKLGLSVYASAGVSVEDGLPLADGEGEYAISSSDADKFFIGSGLKYVPEAVDGSLVMCKLISASVSVNKDNKIWSTGTLPEIVLSTSAEELKAVGSSSVSGNICTFSDLRFNTTYYVWADNGMGTTVYTGKSIARDNNTLSLDYYTLSLEKSDGIQNVSGGGVYLYGTKVTVYATLAEGYPWGQWTSSNESLLPSSENIQYIFNQPDGFVVLTAGTMRLTATGLYNPGFDVSWKIGGGSPQYGTLEAALEDINKISNGAEAAITVYADITAPSGGYTINNQSGSEITISSFGQACTLKRSSDSSLLDIKKGDVILSNIVFDGGAKWETDGKNTGIKSSSAVVTCLGGLTLKDGAVIRNGDNINDNNNGWRSQSGGISIYGKGSALSLMGGQITGCSSVNFGGGIMAWNCASVSLKSSRLDNNSSEFGGGMMLYNCMDVAVDEMDISYNVAKWGAGMYLLHSSAVMENIDIHNNNVTDHSGGVYVSGTNSVLEMKSGNIHNNHSDVSGGGITLGFGGSLKMSGGKITDNDAGRDGGGVKVAGGSFTMTGGSITGNKAGSVGGGLSIRSNDYENNSVVYLNGDPKITGNSLSDGTVSNAYLSKNTTVDIIGTLADTAAVGITPSSSYNGKILSNGIGTYKITSGDLDKFFLDKTNGFGLVLNGNDNCIILKEDSKKADASKADDPAVNDLNVNGQKMDDLKADLPKVDDTKADDSKVNGQNVDSLHVDSQKEDGQKEIPKTDDAPQQSANTGDCCGRCWFILLLIFVCMLALAILSKKRKS